MSAPVASADANASGSAAAVAQVDANNVSARVDGPAKRADEPVKQGSAASTNVDMPPPDNDNPMARMLRSSGVMQLAPFKLAAIDGQLLRLESLQHEIWKMELPAADGRIKLNVTRYPELQKQATTAEIGLASLIRNETSRLSRGDSDVWWVEDRLIGQYNDTPHDKNIREAISNNRRLRVTTGVEALIGWVKGSNGELSLGQRAKADNIVANAIKWVNEPRDGNQFGRMAALLQDTTYALQQAVDEGPKFDPNPLFDTLTTRWKKDMGITAGTPDAKKFDAIVKEYRGQLNSK